MTKSKIEIERKFLVKYNPALGKGQECVQGYISANNTSTVRVRAIGDKGYLTVKGATEGISRPEYEYEVPVLEAKEMLSTMCIRDQLVEKTRYKILHEEMTWEVDVFHGKNNGLIIAEIELSSEDQKFEIPDWLGEEVSNKKQYYNVWLSKYPYSEWRT